MTSLLLLVSLTAHAGDLVWNWVGASPVRYHAETVIATPPPFGYRYLGTQNKDARLVRHEVVLEMTCQAAPAGKRWAIDCKIDEAAVSGEAIPGEQDKLDVIFTEYGEMLTGSTVQLEVAGDGRVLQVDLEGASKKDARHAQIHELLRQMLRRVFTPLDVPMPKDGESKDKPWRQKGSPLALQLLSTTGTAGGVVMKYEEADRVEGDVLLIGSGRGNVSIGADMEKGNKTIINLIGSVKARFDTAAGVLDWCDVTTTGELTASSTGTGAGKLYTQISRIRRIHADGSMEADQEGPK